MIDTNTYEPKTATVRARYIALYGQHGTLSGVQSLEMLPRWDYASGTPS